MSEMLKSSAKRVAGLRQVLRCLEKDELKTVYLAKDADNKIRQKVLNLSQARGIPVEMVEDMRLLGKMCSIGVPACVAGLLRAEP